MLDQQLEVEGEGDENVPLYYYTTDNIQIQLGREEFCLVIGLRFGDENLADYNDPELPIPFRRRVFPSCYDGEHITSYMVLEIIQDEVFDRLHAKDAVSLCCLGILHLVLLGVEAKRRIPDWMLRLANDRVGKGEHRPSFYKRSPYTEQPPTTILPKQCGNKNKNNVLKANLSPLDLGNAFDDENEGGSDVIFLVANSLVKREGCVNYTEFLNDPHHIYLDCYMKGYSVPVTFWKQLVPHLCVPDIDSRTPMGWLSGEHMNAWMELLIRSRRNNALWTVAYTNTISVHLENQRFLIETDQHTIGTLDGSTHPYPAWSVVN
nr:hypothetical protein [Tanacetum cinerariifolium]